MSTNECGNCAATYEDGDVFCEQCGFDFITGSLPEAPDEANVPDASDAESNDAESNTEEVPSVFAPERDGVITAGLPVLVLEVSLDRNYFDSVVSDGEVEFPDPVPEAKRLELAGHELHIGRTSESRAIHPDIDLAELTGDQAVSGRHAVIRLDAEGNSTVADVGSTNGTLVGDLDSDPLIEGVPVVFEVGHSAYFGAWTKIERLA